MVDREVTQPFGPFTMMHEVSFPMKRCFAIAVLAFFVAEGAQAQAADPNQKAASPEQSAANPQENAATPENAAPTTAPPGWRAYNRSAELRQDGKREVIHVDARLHEGVIWQEGSDFKDGTIEVELRGKNAAAHSMLGIAFRGVDDTHFDAVFFRPFNFKIPVSRRTDHAVQYISLPDYTWLRLRTGAPGKYEHAISPAPDPDGWFKARVVIEGQAVNVYVNDAAKPTLSVTALSDPRAGQVGLFVGFGSDGDFANLKLTPKQ
jgi:hypothetical protein